MNCPVNDPQGAWSCVSISGAPNGGQSRPAERTASPAQPNGGQSAQPNGGQSGACITARTSIAVRIATIEPAR